METMTIETDLTDSEIADMLHRFGMVGVLRRMASNMLYDAFGHDKGEKAIASIVGTEGVEVVFLVQQEREWSCEVVLCKFHDGIVTLYQDPTAPIMKNFDEGCEYILNAWSGQAWEMAELEWGQRYLNS